MSTVLEPMHPVETDDTANVPVAGALARANGLVTRLGAIVASHTLVDVYSAFLPPLLGVLEVRCNLTAVQTAWLLGIGSIASGVSQPIAAWLSDRTDTRIFGAVGLLVAAVCLSCIGLADNFATLAWLYALGMIGSGVFHPTGAASMGQLARQIGKGRRGLGIGIFHVSGMIGGIAGSILATRLTESPHGFALLRIVMIPGIAFAIILHIAIRRMPHRHHDHHLIRFNREEIRNRWLAVGVLYVTAALRFIVNMALVYLFVRWVHDLVAAANVGMDEKTIAKTGSPIVGNLNAMLILGMAIGGVSAGAMIRVGREKWPMTLVPILAAPCVALFPWVGVSGGYALAVISGLGFAAMVPVSISLAQRLLPHRTSLASGLMLGGAWMLAFVGPRGAEYCLSTLNLGLPATFGLTAATLAISGVLCAFLNSELLRQSALHH
jgi:FSR family fosmidomycin resistance protein-like MFS transporter